MRLQSIMCLQYNMLPGDSNGLFQLAHIIRHPAGTVCACLPNQAFVLICDPAQCVYGNGSLTADFPQERKASAWQSLFTGSSKDIAGYHVIRPSLLDPQGFFQGMNGYAYCGKGTEGVLLFPELGKGQVDAVAADFLRDLDKGVANELNPGFTADRLRLQS